VEQAAQQVVNAKLEALWRSTAWVWDLVLERPDGTSSSAASLTSAVELIEDHLDVAVANGVCYGTRSALAVTLTHFLKLVTKLELLWSGRNADLMEDQVDALCTQVCQASDSLASFIPSSIAHGLLDGAGEE
jgi:hypothetical protein